MNYTSSPPTSEPGTMPSCEAAVEHLALTADSWACAEASCFRGTSGVVDCHLTVRLTGNPDDPAGALEQAWLAALVAMGIDPSGTVLRRIFCSDVVNQAAPLGKFARAYPGAVSIIGQSPLPAAKLAIWSQHLYDPACALITHGDDRGFSCARGDLTHHWLTGWCDTHADDSAGQTRRVLAAQDTWLATHGMTMADNVVRTWWFVRNIDTDYQGLVDARREIFTSHGLTEHSHYIASTGIAGAAADLGARVALDTLAIAGLQAEQITYPSAPSHLGPTSAYGVTFERATTISFADRRLIYISGTASIDRHGNILHEGQVMRQLDRTLENITALLADAHANTGDLASIIVYLRDPADGAAVETALRDRLGPIPMVLVHAPVCRPGWLVEIEGIAIVPAQCPDLPPY